MYVIKIVTEKKNVNKKTTLKNISWFSFFIFQIMVYTFLMFLQVITKNKSKK